MIVKVDGNINKFYVQSLCMLFFPGAKFSENEQEGKGVPIVQVSLRESESGVEAFASIKVDKKMKTGSRFEKYKKKKSHSTAKHSVIELSCVHSICGNMGLPCRKRQQQGC